MRQKFDFEHTAEGIAARMRKMCVRRAEWIKKQAADGKNTKAAERELELLCEATLFLEGLGSSVDDLVSRMVHQFNVEASKIAIDNKNLREIADAMTRAAASDRQVLEHAIRALDRQMRKQA